MGALLALRAFASRTGADNTIALEGKFESMAKWEDFSAQFFTLPDNAEFFHKWFEAEPRSSTTDVWEVIGEG